MFETIALDPLVAAAVALLGVLLGLVLGRVFFPGPREVKRLRGEIERLDREHAEYKSRVVGHFEKTGELIGQMTSSYKAVYDHLADGAQTLCTPGALPKPAFAAPRLIVDETVNVGVAPPPPSARSDAQPAATPQSGVSSRFNDGVPDTASGASSLEGVAAATPTDTDETAKHD